ncbi:MAG: hypothetical protein OJF60_001475 [Burkholderiaceae bacterium]|jgi:hypothetical protein|nr:MAG: hypothetical protein OJF60_001475 [Burkholderiaceae bacterium]
MTHDEANRLAGLFIRFLETGAVPDGLFTADVLCDFTLPKWRLQAQGIEGMAALRKAGHPGPGTVPRWRCDATESGFVLEFEEQWVQDGKEWYSREMVRADARSGTISEFAVYCTGDWDAELRARHAASVVLVRP